MRRCLPGGETGTTRAQQGITGQDGAAGNGTPPGEQVGQRCGQTLQASQMQVMLRQFAERQRLGKVMGRFQHVRQVHQAVEVGHGAIASRVTINRGQHCGGQAAPTPGEQAGSHGAMEHRPDHIGWVIRQGHRQGPGLREQGIRRVLTAPVMQEAGQHRVLLVQAMLSRKPPGGFRHPLAVGGAFRGETRLHG